MQYVKRSDWGAQPAKSKRKMNAAPDGWFWHWLGVGYPEEMSDEQIMRSVQRYHQVSQGWADFAYHWAIGRDGRIYEGRGWGVTGGATRGFNSTSYALVFLIGEGERPTAEMFAAAERVMDAGPSGASIRPHREVRQTTCPGDDIAAYIETRNPFGGPPSMTLDEAKSKINYLYLHILGREADTEGMAYWSQKLMDGASINDIRWQFLQVRLAADRAELNAALEAIEQRTLSEDTLNDIANDAVKRFYAGLAELLAAQT